MRETFRLQPEWGFFDRTTQEMRSIDLLAVRDLYDLHSGPRRRVRPSLAVVIECKSSILPFVFFDSSEQVHGVFPHFAGLRSEHITLTTDDDRSTYSYPIHSLFGLHREPFSDAPPACSTLSKCARKGSDVVLTGTDAYHSIAMPIRSAVEHFRQASQPVPTAHYFDAFMLVGLAVLDAPMLSVSVGTQGQTEIAPVEWYRIWRHEPLAGDQFLAHHGEASAIDVVHKEFLPVYLEEHLLPFADRFAELALRHDEVLATAKGFVPGLGRGPRLDIEADLEPRTVESWVSADNEIIDASIPRAIASVAKASFRARIEATRLRRRQRPRRR
jgi:hypothetical protein